MSLLQSASPTGLIAATYVRVSTGLQEKEQTIEAQIDEVKQKVLANGDHLAADLIFRDDGWTGEMLQRPGLDAMREAAMAGRFQVLYVYDRGRLSRIFAYQEILIEELENRQILFRSLHDIEATTPEDKAVQAMQGVFHQYERVKIAERFRMAKLFKARNGVLVSSQLPYGYTRIRRSEEAPARAEVNADKASVVRLIRQWYGVERLTMTAISERLHQLKVPSPRMSYERWSAQSVKYVLRCATYHTGIVYFQQSEAIIAKNPRQNGRYRRVKRTSHRPRPMDQWLPIPVPTLVPNDGLYERIQELLDEHRRYAPRNRKYAYLLAGKVSCGCGERRVGDGYGENHYYRCLQKTSRLAVERTCPLPGVNAHLLDETVWSNLETVLTHAKLLEKHATGWTAAHRDEDGVAQTQRERLLRLVAAARDEEQRYIKAYGAGTLDFGQLRPFLTELKHRKTRYAKELSELSEAPRPVLQFPPVATLCRCVVQVVKSLKVENKAIIVRDLVEKVVIGANRAAEIWGKVPLSFVNVGFPLVSAQTQAEDPCLEFRIRLQLPNLRSSRPENSGSACHLQNPERQGRSSREITQVE